MVSRTAILIDPDRVGADGIDWSEIGHVATQFSELYQLTREQRIDVILVNESRSDLKQGVANRLRRFNPLTEIWLLTRGEVEAYDEYNQAIFDGTMSVATGTEDIAQKVRHVLHGKELLADYGLVGRSARMKSLAETIQRVAPTDVVVMIVGPSGAGKELVARAIHHHSQRRGKPYVAINCGAIPEGLLESELFGHERGAFTGSVGKREGLFHKAEGGTLLLDEIGEMSPDMQVKLLRVLEDGTYFPVGSSVSRRADVRILSATNRDLTEAIAERQFREDLYYRIGVVKIVVPSVLERKGDIQPLLHHFWRQHPKLEYTDDALDLLRRYDWPGNVRQLKNFADRMVALKGAGMVRENDVEHFIDEQQSSLKHLPVVTGKTVEEAGQELIYRAILQLGNEVRLLRDLITAHVPSDSMSEPVPHDIAPGEEGATMEDIEREMIQRTLDKTGGNRKETARRLGIGERTLYRKLKKYDLR